MYGMTIHKLFIPLNEVLQQNQANLFSEFANKIPGLSFDDFQKLSAELEPALFAWKSGKCTDDMFYAAVLNVLSNLQCAKIFASEDEILPWFKNSWQTMNPGFATFLPKLKEFYEVNRDHANIEIVFVSHTNPADMERFKAELQSLSGVLACTNHSYGSIYHMNVDTGYLVSVMGIPLYCSYVLGKNNIAEVIGYVIEQDNLSFTASSLGQLSLFSPREPTAYRFINSQAELALSEDVENTLRNLGVEIMLGKLNPADVKGSIAQALNFSLSEDLTCKA
jgi:hypothetical protein